MTFRKRSLVIGCLLVIASALYGAARYYSPFLIRYVVEQSLIQKAPAGAGPAILHERLRAHLSAAPNQKSQIERLLRISESLEKVQGLSFEQLDQLLKVDGPENTRSFGK